MDFEGLGIYCFQLILFNVMINPKQDFSLVHLLL